MSVIATVGYPGAGKSVVADIASENGYEVVTMGDYIREKAREEIPQKLQNARSDETDKTVSDVIGDFATQMRSEYGEDIVAKWVYNDIADKNVDILIDGIRSIESVTLFKNQIDAFKVVFIHTPAHKRLTYITDRGRDDEETFTAEDLVQRDKRESGWGVDDVIMASDKTIHNCGTLDAFKSQILSYIQQQSV